MKTKREDENMGVEEGVSKRQRLVEDSPSSSLSPPQAIGNPLFPYNDADDEEEDHRREQVNSSEGDNYGNTRIENGYEDNNYDDDDDESLDVQGPDQGNFRKQIEPREDCPYLDTVNRQVPTIQRQSQEEQPVDETQTYFDAVSGRDHRGRIFELDSFANTCYSQSSMSSTAASTRLTHNNEVAELRATVYTLMEQIAHMKEEQMAKMREEIGQMIKMKEEMELKMREEIAHMKEEQMAKMREEIGQMVKMKEEMELKRREEIEQMTKMREEMELKMREEMEQMTKMEPKMREKMEQMEPKMREEMEQKMTQLRQKMEQLKGRLSSLEHPRSPRH